MPLGKILIIDDDESIRKVLGFILEEAGYQVETSGSAQEGLDRISQGRPDLVLSDIKMPSMDGIALLKEIKRLDNSIPVIMLTAFGTVETAVEAMKLGASDYLAKPISRDELKLTVQKTLKLQHLEKENEALKESLREKLRFENIVGLSAAMSNVFDIIRKIAPTDASVLITGESGTGKELVAKAIHHHSPRKDARLVTINCAAIPSELLESELFGHVKGAFTGAIRDKEGKFQQAHGGTMFLDEIGSMPLNLQAKILRALQEKEIERVGDDRLSIVDVRIIAATNRPLTELISKGEFREDLFYRLNVVPLRIPPLRERMSDIPLLVRHFMKKITGGSKVAFTKKAIEVLNSYSWPGNVRELENFCERLILMRSRDTIDETAVKEQLAIISRELAKTTSNEIRTLPELEKRLVVDTLDSCGWNQTQAAKLLGIPRHVLIYRMKKFGIKRYKNKEIND
ncbi:MAG: response regulator [Candidatus Latescibacteria bacterium]|nr:response regulator [Candidatus Latescibacterota bacterium]NIM64534.1 response regulator [Candidatus Latescibacterota bacterium]NIO00687.1 response regulator [Candidatus Latescibacterota bacterium]NIO27090.1 response regulator [Candidatus Latescibacterota bacterium]NIO54614.1 response regulator [Candidatus Latescibacterota bacterium]